ncbi:monocarboxylate transporter 12-like [Glandiceps talaboti]
MKNKESLQTEGPDGGWGWMIVLAASLADGLIGTFAFGMSPLFVELRRYFNATAEETSWILSIQYISNTFGLGIAGSYSPHSVMMTKYFPTRFALVHTLMKLGGGTALFILPPIMQACLDHYGWRGAFLVQSAIFANLCVCGALLRPIREVYIPTKSDDNNEEIAEESAQHEIKHNSSERYCVFSYCRGYLAVCQKPRFVIYLVTLATSAAVHVGAMIHLIPRASEAQVGTSQQLSLLISIAGIFSLVSRLICGIIVHLKILSAMAICIMSVTLWALLVSYQTLLKATSDLSASVDYLV